MNWVLTVMYESLLSNQEAILLDLLRVIRHHRARLATPIRTVQKFYGDSDIEKIPFADTIFSRPGAASSRSLLLIEPPFKAQGEEKPKSRQAPRAGGEDLKETSSVSEAPLPEGSDRAPPPKPSPEEVGPDSEEPVPERSEEKRLHRAAAAAPGDAQMKSSATEEAPSSPPAKLQPEGSGVGSLGSKESPPGSASALEDVADGATSPAPPPSERSHGPPPPSVPSRPSLEENIVLGVALDGAKRTLPIEEGMVPAPNPADSKELASLRSGSGPASAAKEKKDGQAPAPGGAAAEQPRDQER